MGNESRTLYLSLIAGVAAAFMLYSYSMEKQTEYNNKYGKMQTVVVAKVDIKEMETINITMLDTIAKPTDFVEPGVLKDAELAVGQVTATPIKKGEQILSTKLLQPGPDTGISLQVAPQRRAVTLPVDEIRGVAKLIRPGDRVDIYAAVDSGRGSAQKREVMMLMQDVVVLATGINVVNNIPRSFEIDANSKNVVQTTLTGDTKYTSLTIEASPKEAQDLIYIMATAPGNLFFTLRNPNDRLVPPRIPASSAETILGRPVVNLDNPMPYVAAPMPPQPALRAAPAPVLPAKRPGGFKPL